MATKIVTYFQTFGNETSIDLLSGLYGYIPEEIEVVNSSARRSAGGVIAEITISGNVAEAEAVARAFSSATGMPSRDVTIRGKAVR